MTDLDFLQKQINNLEGRLQEVERSSWMVSTAFWKRAVAVAAHVTVVYILLIFAGFVAEAVFTLITSSLR